MSDTLALQFRTLFRRLTSGVAIVAIDGPTGPIGMTVNSLTSVSLDPPLLLFCGRQGSVTAARIAATGRFSVSLLTAEQEAASRHYAGAAGVESAWEWARACGLPWLAGANAAFLCRVETVHPAGDHQILIGRVEDMIGPEAPGDALLYHGGRYARLPFTSADPVPPWEDLWWTG